MYKPTLTVIAFPGNNCETETARAANRNGFEANIIRWNQPEEVGKSDAYILPGGFSFEDRGRSGALSAREPIFDALREEAKKGKIILGICNGAQMIVESGLIPIEGNSLPLALADNIRRDKTGHVLGTGYYNTWVCMKADRKDTAFTLKTEGVIPVPVAHGEGRFTSIDSKVVTSLTKKSDHVAFRYCDKDGNHSTDYPVTPNGALGGVAAITNKEGTIMAIMPHPERFYTTFEADGILASMHTWIKGGKSPKHVTIGDLSSTNEASIEALELPEDAVIIEKELIITDNAAFSVSQAASALCGEEIVFHKSTLFVIEGKKLDEEALLESGLILNPNKERIPPHDHSENTVLVKKHEDDQAEHLADQIKNRFKTDCEVTLYTVWDLAKGSEEGFEKVLQNNLLSNPNSSSLYEV